MTSARMWPKANGNHKSFGASSATSVPLSQPSGNRHADILPHTREAGDPYYIGDIYHRFDNRKNPNPYPPPGPNTGNFQQEPVYLGPYHDHLRKLSSEWLDIGYLAQWMEVTTQPTKLRFLNSIDKEERASRTNVTVLDFDKDFKPSQKDYDNIKSLKQDFDKGPNDTNDKVHARLIIVEDLSRDVIETLGTRFDVDPLFFRQQISDYTWYNNRDPWVQSLELDLVQSQRNFFHMGYVQSRYFKDLEEIKAAKKEAGHFNVLRRLDLSENWTPVLEPENSDVALVRSNMSLWVRTNSGNEEGWLGILLVDPPLKSGHPLWGGYRSFSKTPSMHSSTISSGPPRDSIRADMIYWLTAGASSSDLATFQHSHTGFSKVLIRKIFQIVCTEWLLMMSHVKARIALIEWELQRPLFIPQNEAGLHHSLNKLFPWRRRLPFYHEQITTAFDQITKRPQFLSIPTTELVELVPDFETIRSKFQTIVNHSEKVLTAATAIISIEESKKATAQNKGVSRLTYIALTFAPLSFLSSFFSMVDDVGQLRKTFWIYFSVAIPLTMVLLFIASVSKYVGKTKKNLKKSWRARRAKSGRKEMKGV